MLEQLTMPEAAPFIYYLRVRYGDCDQQGVVFNARYGEYVDLALSEFMRVAMPAGSSAEQVKTVRQVIEWKQGAVHDDILGITVRCTKIGTTSFTLAMAIHRIDPAAPQALTQVLSETETVYVFTDPRTFEKTAIPAAVRSALELGAPGAHIDHAGLAAAAAAIAKG
ncbi:MAG: thioesterase family protein [Pseudomonadota bacterium]